MTASALELSLGAMASIASVPVGSEPDAVAYDSANGYVYVANQGSGNLTVINGTTGLIVGSISVPNWPDAVVYDSANGYVYVVNKYEVGQGNTGDVAVINGSTDQVVGIIAVGGAPDGIAYDSANGYLYVADNAWILFNGEYVYSGVSVINGTSDQLVTVIPTGPYPAAVAYDNANGYLYVADYETHNVTVINGANDTVVGSVQVGYGPLGVAYDSANGYLYVTNEGSNNVTVINGANDTVVGMVLAPGEASENSVTYDSANGYLYVGITPNVVWPINGSSDAGAGLIPVGIGPDGVAYDSANGYLYVANWDSNNVTVLAPAWMLHPVTFSESGLPAGRMWYVNITGGPDLSGTTPSLSTTLPNGTYQYSLSAADKEYAASGGSFTVSGAAVSEPVTFGLVTYAVTFTEIGLPSGTEWFVNGTGTGEDGAPLAFTGQGSGNTLSFDLPNGTYTYTVATTDKQYAASSSSFPVNGAAVSESVVFSLVTYTVTFTETGLPSGTLWYVNVTNGPSLSGTTTALTTSLANGSYRYTVGVSVVGKKGYSAPGGSFTVDGAPYSTTLAFALVYPVTFTEKGLPSGTEWWANVTGGVSTSSTLTTLKVWEPTGTYGYTVGSANRQYEAKSGSFTVGTKAVSVKVTFKLVTFAVTFSESGLPVGAKWCVVITGGKSYCTTKGSVSFAEPNGTYAYSLTTTKAGYTAPGGSFLVNGAAVSVTVKFSP